MVLEALVLQALLEPDSVRSALSESLQVEALQVEVGAARLVRVALLLDVGWGAYRVARVPDPCWAEVGPEKCRSRF